MTITDGWQKGFMEKRMKKRANISLHWLIHILKHVYTAPDKKVSSVKSGTTKTTVSLPTPIPVLVRGKKFLLRHATQIKQLAGCSIIKCIISTIYHQIAY